MPVGFKLAFTASGTAGNRTAPLTHITNTVYGLTSNGKYFPTCSLNTIRNAKNDTGCKKGALVASGGLTAVLGPASNLSTSAKTTPCARNIDAWNAGQGKLVFFFKGAPNTCGGLTTGAVGPFPATLKVKSGTLTVDLPIPKSVSFPIPGLQGSLLTEHLTFTKQSTKVHGKTVAFFASVGCKGAKRPLTTSFTAAGQTVTVPAKAPCTKLSNRPASTNGSRRAAELCSAARRDPRHGAGLGRGSVGTAPVTLHGIVAGLPAPPPAVVPAWPPHASGYRVALDEGDWWAYRGRDTRVERAYCPAHHENAVGVEGAAAA